MKGPAVWSLAGVSLLLGCMIGLEAHVERGGGNVTAYSSYLADSQALAQAVAFTPKLVRQLERQESQWQALHAVTTHAADGLRMLEAEVERAQRAAGLTPLTGNGVRIRVAFDAGLPLIPGLHYVDEATQLQMLVNYLQAAGAAGIAINGQRLTTISSIRTVGSLGESSGPFSGVVQVNQVPVSAPYIVEAVGPVQAMANMLEVEGIASQFNILDQSFGLTRYAGHRTLTLPAYAGPLPGQYASEVGY